MSDVEDLMVENFEENGIEVVEELEDEASSEQVAPKDEGEDAAPEQVVKPKRIIRNPQPKLNAQTLKEKRGLTALPSYFERVKFKGKGHEEEDLGVILRTYEYWCHRLFPKYPFDECLAKIELLGTKRATVTHIKKIRADLVFDDEPIINDDNDPDAEEIPNSFDNLLSASDAQPSNTPISSMDISEEQMERMRVNKERAEKIRREKRQAMELAQSSSRENNTLDNENFIFEQNPNEDLAAGSSHSHVDAHDLSDNGETAKHFVSQSFETNNQEQNTTLRTPTDLVTDRHSVPKISSIIDSDEDF